MRTLAIDCATPACSIALFDDGALVAHDHRVLGRGHAERLVPMIAALPARGRADRILVSRGPGSFTGVRIGIATARALAYAWGAELRGYPTLALVAAMGRERAGAMALTVCMTGGHGEWFVQGFDADGVATGEHASLSPADAVARYTGGPVVGDQANAFAHAAGPDNIANTIDLLPDAAETLHLPPHDLTRDVGALYGRPPDARPVAIATPPK